MDLEKIFEDNKELYNKLLELDRLKSRIKKESIKPVLITILGSPRTGKTMLVNNLFDFIKKCGISSTCFQEPAGEMYKKFKTDEEKKEAIKDAYAFNNSLRTLAVNNLLNATKDKTILYDRGYLDTYVWNRMYYEQGIIDKDKYDRALSYLDSFTFDVDHLVFALHCDPLVSVKRDYQNTLSLDNRKVITKEFLIGYRNALLEIEPLIKKEADYYNYIDNSETSVMDTSIVVANGVCEYLLERAESSKVKSLGGVYAVR